MKRVLTIFLACFAVCILILMGCDDTATNPEEETTKMALVYPKGGETFSIGDTICISFMANADSVSSVRVQVTSNNGSNYFNIAKTAVSISGSGSNTYTPKWVVGQEAEFGINVLYKDTVFGSSANPHPAWNCHIKIYDSDNSSVYEVCDDFTVNLMRPFFLRFPIGGEEYNLTDTIPIVATYRTDSMSIIQYFFWSLEEEDWSQIVKVNEILRQDDYKLVTFTKKLVPADSSSFPYPLGDSTKIRINDYDLNRPMESGWIKINKKN